MFRGQGDQEKGPAVPGTARKSIVAGYNHAFVEIEFHVLSSLSMRPRTGQSDMCKVYRWYNFDQSVKPV